MEKRVLGSIVCEEEILNFTPALIHQIPMLIDEGKLFQLLFEEDSQLEIEELDSQTTRETILALIINILRVEDILGQKFSNSKPQALLKSEMASWSKEQSENLTKFREFFSRPELEPDYKQLVFKAKQKGGNFLRLVLIMLAESAANIQPLYSEIFDLFEVENTVEVINAFAPLIGLMNDRECRLMIEASYK